MYKTAQSSFVGWHTCLLLLMVLTVTKGHSLQQAWKFESTHEFVLSFFFYQKNKMMTEYKG